MDIFKKVLNIILHFYIKRLVCIKKCINKRPNATSIVLGAKSFTSLKADLLQDIKKEVLHLAGAIMEDFLEGNTQLSDWHVNSEEGRFVIVTLLIWVNVPFPSRTLLG